MSQIKSALEIALERTKGIDVDKASIETVELKQAGKRLAGDFFRDPDSVDVAKALKVWDAGKDRAVREGAFEVFASRLQLPVTRTVDVDASFELVGKGLAALGGPRSDAKAIMAMVMQIAGFMKRYAEDIANLDAQIRKQFEPRLKRKEQEYAARTGRPVRVDPMSDPEFVAFYQQNAGKLKAQYQAALDDAKGELAATLGIEPREK